MGNIIEEVTDTATELSFGNEWRFNWGQGGEGLPSLKEQREHDIAESPGRRSPGDT